MIVKNEAHVIRRCLDSVRPLIDRWVIVDTGSTDGTQALIRELMADVPGELHERPWVDFSTNRNQALDLAREGCGEPDGRQRDYAFVIDADEELQIAPDFMRPDSRADAYEIQILHDDTRYARNCLVALDRPWHYEGVLHEVLVCERQPIPTPLPGLQVIYRAEGARSRNPRKFHDDAAVFEEALEKEPDNARYVFYLAQSYRDAGEPQKALSAYQRRAGMPGWDEETWFALFQVARLKEVLRLPEAEVAHAYLYAYQGRPARAEPLLELARFHRERGNYAVGMLYARQAATIPRPADRLFVDEACYRWRALDELSITAFYTGDTEAGRTASRQLLADAAFPAREAERIRKNAAFYAERGV